MWDLTVPARSHHIRGGGSDGTGLESVLGVGPYGTGQDILGVGPYGTGQDYRNFLVWDLMAPVKENDLVA